VAATGSALLVTPQATVVVAAAARGPTLRRPTNSERPTTRLVAAVSVAATVV
jgi:hypothetical protein